MIKIEGKVTIDDVDQVLKKFIEDDSESSFLISIEDKQGNGFSSMQGYKGRLIKTLFNLLMVDKEEHMIACLNEATKMYMIEKQKEEHMRRISLSCKGTRKDN